MRYKEQTIDINKVAFMLNELYHSALDDLEWLVKQASPRGATMPPPPSPQDNIIDDLSNIGAHQSFASPINPDLSEQRTYLVSAVTTDPELKGKWIARREVVDGKITAVRYEAEMMERWLARSSDLTRKLAVLIHVGSGSLGRGTEITSVKLINTEATQRNLFWIGGHLAVRVLYWKGSALLESDKVRLYLL
jgi:hypothetical protein